MPYPRWLALKTKTDPEIYKSAYKKKDCTSEKASKESLEKAKAYIKNLGLSPEPNAFKKRGITETWNSSFLRGEAPYPALAQRKIYSNQHTVFWVDTHREDSGNNTQEEIKSTIQVANAKQTEKIIWKRVQEDFFSMGSGGMFYLPRAYKSANKIAFLEWFFHENHMDEYSTISVLSFTPAFDIPK